MASLDDGHVIGRAITPEGVLPDAYVAWRGGVISEVRPAVPGDRSPSRCRAVRPMMRPGPIP